MISVALLVAVLLAGTFSHVNLAVLAMAGAAGLVLTGTVRAQEVPRVVNWSVVALLGGMLALGKAFSRVHLDQTIADWFVGLGEEGMSPRMMLGVLLVGSVLFTQVMNYIATAVIMAPVAIAMATAAGLDPRPFLMAVIAGTEFAFMSPIAHQSNAMVLGPGGYRYKHFMIAGGPLTVMLIAASLVLIPMFWPLQ
jgi:di/tricarboxylate transporter